MYGHKPIARHEIVPTDRRTRKAFRAAGAWRQLERRVKSMIRDYPLTGAEPVLCALEEKIEEVEDMCRAYSALVTVSANEHRILQDILELPGALKRARLELRWSQAELARQAGLSDKLRIQRWEKNNYESAKLRDLRNVARVLQLALAKRSSRE